MATAETSSLRRAITAPMLTLFILGDVLGAGVYALAGTIAGRVGGAIWAPLLIALCFALLTAASYAELVTKYPRAGGAAVYAEKAFGKPLLSFLVGFSMVAAGVTSAAGLAVAFAGDYFQALLDWPAQWVCVAFLVIVGLLNARGIKESLSANFGDDGHRAERLAAGHRSSSVVRQPWARRAATGVRTGNRLTCHGDSRRIAAGVLFVRGV